MMLVLSVGMVAASDNADNLTASDDIDEITVVDENIVEDSQDDVLSADGTYSELNSLISSASAGDEIKLNKSYTFDSSSSTGISISKAITIDGQGYTIDANQMGRIFQVSVSGVTLKNIIFKNAKYTGTGGGAIHWNAESGSVVNCTFTDNIGKYGGAINFNKGSSSLINSTFINNTATRGGSVYLNKDSCTIDNCNFEDNYPNSISSRGCAIEVSGKNNKVINCNFTNNGGSGLSGGAIYWSGANGELTNCIFNNNYVRTNGGAIYWSGDSGIINSSKFNTNVANSTGGAIYVSGDAIIIANSIFNSNTDIYNESGAIYILTGKTAQLDGNTYSTTSDTVNASGATILNSKILFISPSGTGNGASSSTPTNWTYAYSNIVQGGIIYFTSGTYTDIINETISKTLSLIGQGTVTVNLNNKGRAFTVSGTNVLIVNINFQNGYVSDEGGAIKWLGNNGNITGCTFTSNSAYAAGALYWEGNEGFLADSTFTSNTATQNAGAVYWYGDEGTIINCTFTGNKVTGYNGGAFYGWGDNISISNCDFTSNTAAHNGAAVISLGDGTTLVDSNFTSNVASEGSIIQFSGSDSTYSNLTDSGNSYTVSFLTDNNKEDTNLVNTSISASDVNMTYGESTSLVITLVDVNGTVLSGKTVSVSLNGTKSYSTDSNGQVTIPISLGVGNYTAVFSFAGDSVYNASSNTASITVNKADENATLVNTSISASDVNMTYGESTSLVITLVDVNGTVLSGKTVSVSLNGTKSYSTDSNGQVTIPISLGVGNYTAVFSFAGDSVYNASSNTANIVVNKAEENTTLINTVISASAISTTYNAGKYLVITLKDASGNVLKAKTVTITLNKKTVTRTTNDNGQIKLLISLAPGSYTASFSFAGDSTYNSSSNTASVKITKAKVKIVAKKKTFKKSKKVKKYKMTLKDNKGKVMKKVKVYLKVNKKTYKATTNKKGKATFKIKKLTKKGNFKAKITFKATKYYKKATKKVKIKVKS